ncbi:hypothetical protein KFS98_003586 [Salmonella enterica]|nr:hypothetical protein [Salmonella enterica]
MERIMIVPRDPSKVFTDLDRGKIVVFFKQYYRILAMPIEYRNTKDSLAVNREDFPQDKSVGELIEEIQDKLTSHMTLSVPPQVMSSNIFAITSGVVRGHFKSTGVGHMDQIPKTMYTGHQSEELTQLMKEVLDAPGEARKLVIIPLRKIENFSSADLELIQRHLKGAFGVDSKVVSPEDQQTRIEVPFNQFAEGTDLDNVRKILMDDFFKLILRLSVKHSVVFR